MTGIVVSEPARTRVGFALKRAQQTFEATVSAVLEPLGITPAGYALLMELRSVPGLSNADLARRSSVTPQTTHQVLCQLERGGLVQRSAHPVHGRIRRNSLTERGEDTLSVADEAVLSLERRMVDGLTRSELDVLQLVLRRLAEALLPAVR